MKDLEIKLIGGQNLGDFVVIIDDEPVDVKKNEFNSSLCRYQTEHDKVNIKIFRLLDVGGLIWFITQLFFFVISIFGIFDIHRKERCLIVDFEAEVDLKDVNKLTLRFNIPKENVQAVSIQTDLTFQEVSNKYYTDVKAKRTLKWLKITKIFLALAIIATAIALLMINFGMF